MGRLASLLIVLTAALWAQPGIEGTWQGTLQVGPSSLRLGLHIARDAKGALTSTLDSIDQGAMGMPVKQTAFSERKLHLELPNISAKYDGTLSEDGAQITGTFTQGAPFPLTFKRVTKVEILKRPQNPKPPYPYDAVEVTYENRTGIRLAGTLTVPRGQGPFPAAILISGSGPQDRDETLFQHKPFWVIADYLTRRGVAVLRVDDRGVGESMGDSALASLGDMAGDVLAGVDFLKGRKEIDPLHIGVIGHSEGGIVGPVAATQSADVAFVVMLAGTGVNGEQILYRQAELMNRSAAAPDAAIAQNRKVQEMMFAAIRSEKDHEAALVAMRADWEKMKASAPEAERKAMSAGDAAIQDQFRGMLSPEMRSFLSYDPAAALSKLKVPVLALNGSRDLQVDPAQNLPAIRAALTAAGNPDFTVTELPGLNHLFQKCHTCAFNEYGKLEETFSPAALAIMGDWIVRHTRPK